MSTVTDFKAVAEIRRKLTVRVSWNVGRHMSNLLLRYGENLQCVFREMWEGTCQTCCWDTEKTYSACFVKCGKAHVKSVAEIRRKRTVRVSWNVGRHMSNLLLRYGENLQCVFREMWEGTCQICCWDTEKTYSACFVKCGKAHVKSVAEIRRKLTVRVSWNVGRHMSNLLLRYGENLQCVFGEMWEGTCQICCWDTEKIYSACFVKCGKAHVKSVAEMRRKLTVRVSWNVGRHMSNLLLRYGENLQCVFRAMWEGTCQILASSIFSSKIVMNL